MNARSSFLDMKQTLSHSWSRGGLVLKLRPAGSIAECLDGDEHQPHDLFHFGVIDLVRGIAGLMIVGMLSSVDEERRNVFLEERPLIAPAKQVLRRIVIPEFEIKPHLAVG